MVKVYCDKCTGPIDITGKDPKDVRVTIKGHGVGYEFDLCPECHKKLVAYAAGEPEDTRFRLRPFD